MRAERRNCSGDPDALRQEEGIKSRNLQGQKKSQKKFTDFESYLRCWKVSRRKNTYRLTNKLLLQAVEALVRQRLLSPDDPNRRQIQACAPIPQLRGIFRQASQPLHKPFGHDGVQSEVKLQVGCGQGSPLSGISRKRISQRIERPEFYLAMVDAIFIDGRAIFGRDLQHIGRV